MLAGTPNFATALDRWSIKCFLLLSVNQITIGLECYGADPLLSENYWRGLTFFNSTVKAKSRTVNISASILEYVDIMYAGVNSTQNFTAALSASPNPPYLDNCPIMKNGFDGVNFTEVHSEVVIRNSEIAYNRGELLIFLWAGAILQKNGKYRDI